MNCQTREIAPVSRLDLALSYLGSDYGWKDCPYGHLLIYAAYIAGISEELLQQVTFDLLGPAINAAPALLADHIRPPGGKNLLEADKKITSYIFSGRGDGHTIQAAIALSCFCKSFYREAGKGYYLCQSLLSSCYAQESDYYLLRHLSQKQAEAIRAALTG